MKRAVFENPVAGARDECALRFAEAWACLIARKRLTPTAARSAAVMAAVDSHPLTLQQLRRADAVLRLLPGVQAH
ncbi:hypothetical protein D9Q98_010696 [Chlorella vulgaris]|uniref:Uncharacterized protein n=1 Tax=Chlorella vulgaris TaxID=3077 RepID=A0A9D4TEF4_CHLVU|nr:hypothetical protein D9Q98_010696 [Chlorella vulgaris]